MGWGGGVEIFPSKTMGSSGLDEVSMGNLGIRLGYIRLDLVICLITW